MASSADSPSSIVSPQHNEPKPPNDGSTAEGAHEVDQHPTATPSEHAQADGAGEQAAADNEHPVPSQAEILYDNQAELKEQYEDEHAAAGPSHAATDGQGESHAAKAGNSEKRRGLPPVMSLVIMAAVAAAAAWLRRRMAKKQAVGQAAQTQPRGARKSQKGKQQIANGEHQQEEQAPAEEPIMPDTLEVLLPVDAILVPPPPRPEPLPQPPLATARLVVSEDVDISGVPTTCGMAEWRGLPAPAADSALVVKRLVAAGATCLGKTSMQPLGMDLLGANYGSPLNKRRVAGGGCTGAAAALATGLADLAVSTDTAGESRVPAACCGLYAFRPSPGVLGAATSSAASPLGVASLVVMAREYPVLMKAVETLGVPGSANLRGEIIKFVVAQDLFDLCAPELQPATVAIKKAILKWAGADQAGAVQLVRFLATNTTSWQAIRVPPPSDETDAQIRFGVFVEAAVEAARTLRVEELYRSLQYMEPLLPQPEPPAAAPAVQPKEEQAEIDAAAPAANSQPEVQAASEIGVEGEQATAGPAAGAASAVEEAAASVGQEDSAAAAAAAAAAGSTSALSAALPPRSSPEAVSAAIALQKEVTEVLRQTVKPDTIMVIPALPFPPPKRSAEQVEKDVFVKLVQCFSSIASLGGCPTITCPIGSLRDGSPVAISLFSVQRFDMRLLAVAQKLVPMIQDSFQAIKEEITARAVAEAQGEEAAQQAADSTSPSSAAAAAAAAAPPSVDPKRAEKAEKFKAKGNEYYLAGKHADAVTEYTKAINANPNCAVYYNNRAMACIRLFRFEQAEDDCCSALKFPDLSEKDKVKALLRRATARDALQKYDEAERDLKQVLSLEPNNRQAREDLQTLRKHKAEMVAAQRAMVSNLRQQQQQGAGGHGGAAAAMAGMLPPGFDASMLPPGFDPSMLPPGFDASQLGAEYGYEGGGPGYEYQ